MNPVAKGKFDLSQRLTRRSHTGSRRHSQPLGEGAFGMPSILLLLPPPSRTLRNQASLRKGSHPPPTLRSCGSASQPLDTRTLVCPRPQRPGLDFPKCLCSQSSILLAASERTRTSSAENLSLLQLPLVNSSHPVTRVALRRCPLRRRKPAVLKPDVHAVKKTGTRIRRLTKHVQPHCFARTSQRSAQLENTSGSNVIPATRQDRRSIHAFGPSTVRPHLSACPEGHRDFGGIRHNESRAPQSIPVDDPCRQDLQRTIGTAVMKAQPGHKDKSQQHRRGGQETPMENQIDGGTFHDLHFPHRKLREASQERRVLTMRSCHLNPRP